MKFHMSISIREYDRHENVKEIDDRYDRINRNLSRAHNDGIISHDTYLDSLATLYDMREIEKKARRKGGQ